MNYLIKHQININSGHSNRHFICDLRFSNLQDKFQFYLNVIIKLEKQFLNTVGAHKIFVE